MDQTYLTLIIAAALLAAWFLFQRMSFVSIAQARQLLKQGAKVIDVRTAEEFSAGHVKGALNLPLNDLSSRIQEVVKDKNTSLLVHCHSGGRSALAQRKLRGMGYTAVHNLGSLSHARNAVETP